MDDLRMLKQALSELVASRGWTETPVRVTARTLTPAQAIGQPEHDDYPLVKGRERLMEAEFLGSRGQAFTDRFGDFSGSLSEVLSLDLSGHFERAVFLSTLNAVLRQAGLVERTIHCRNEDPPLCARELAGYIRQKYGCPKVAMVGLQPRMVAALAPELSLRVTDLDAENVGQVKFGVTIGGEDQTEANLDWCDLALITGSVLTNSPLAMIVRSKPVLVFGVTGAGPASILGLDRFCPLAG